MTRVLHGAVLLSVGWLSMVSIAARAQPNLAELKSEYESVTAELQKHLVHEFWIDDAPESPELLARQWTLEGAWVAAWLNAHPSAGSDGVRQALHQLDAADESTALELSEGTFLVAARTGIGCVFIVAKLDGQYHLAWSTAQPQEARGEQAEILAAWRPENARAGGRGPYWMAYGSAGPVMPILGLLPTDAKGRARFYIDGIYAQGAGMVVGAQISLWAWDGKTARPQIARHYTVMIDAAVGTRLEGNLLKVREKTFFRTFSTYGPSEERKTDWIVRLTPQGIEDLGETSLNPELDVVDELFYRVIHHQEASDVASPAEAKHVNEIVNEARKGDKNWKEYPSLGIMEDWSVHDNANSKILCLEIDPAGVNILTLKSTGGKLFISDMKPTDKPCMK